MKAVIKHKKQMNRKPLWGAEVMLHSQGNCSNDTNLTHISNFHPQWILQIDTIKQRVPASGMFISSFPNKGEGTVNAFTEAVRTRKYITARAAALQCTLKPLYTGHKYSRFLLSTTWVTHSHPNMSEHIKVTQTRYFQFLVVKHGLKTSKDSSHYQLPLLTLNYSLHVHWCSCYFTQ